jgi:hypothetical protein
VLLRDCCSSNALLKSSTVFLEGCEDLVAVAGMRQAPNPYVGSCSSGDRRQRRKPHGFSLYWLVPGTAGCIQLPRAPKVTESEGSIFNLMA